MPRPAAEPIRRAALINATIATVGRARSLDVTVAQIAAEAGVSAALAHHYFGSKDRLLIAAMRHILTLYGAQVRAEVARTPEDRLGAILRASFAAQNFAPETVAAWLNFYALAQSNAEAARLLRVYYARLQSNLCAALRGRCAQPAAVARTAGALIDGFYLRAALTGAPDAAGALAATGAWLTEVCDA